jgi:hypothetical protein
MSNPGTSFTNSTDIGRDTSDPDSSYHTDYISILIITMLAFFIVSYYLYYIAKQGSKRAKSTGAETTVIHYKYEIIRSLAIANASNFIII